MSEAHGNPAIQGGLMVVLLMSGAKAFGQTAMGAHLNTWDHVLKEKIYLTDPVDMRKVFMAAAHPWVKIYPGDYYGPAWSLEESEQGFVDLVGVLKTNHVLANKGVKDLPQVLSGKTGTGFELKYEIKLVRDRNVPIPSRAKKYFLDLPYLDEVVGQAKEVLSEDNLAYQRALLRGK